jgi:Zn/Cd-binding protein ZinT
MQAVCNAVDGATRLTFKKGVEYEKFLFRELIQANQQEKIIQFEEIERGS